MKRRFVWGVVLFVSMPVLAVSDCPDGGVRGLNDSCCKDGWFYNKYENGYTQLYVPDCGCPDGGVPSGQYKNVGGYVIDTNFSCCKNNYEYDTETRRYDKLYPEICGCPDGGSSNDYYGNKICCKDGYKYNEDTKSYDEISIEGCGCPAGSELREGQWSVKYCCRDGIALRPYDKPSVEPVVCGCPAGGTIWKGHWVDGLSVHVNDTCQKNGYLWNENSQKYEIPNASLGCPPESEEKSGFCCKGGYTFNSRTSRWDGVNGVCGCPEGSVQSEWASALRVYLSGKTKGKEYMTEMAKIFEMACCQNGKLYNEETGRFDAEDPIHVCGKPPQTEEEWRRVFF